MKTTRTYSMGARAEAVQATRERILDAALSLSGEKPLAGIVLTDVAERADVSVQTVLRQFGNRDGMLAAAAHYAAALVQHERVTSPGDVDAAVRTVLDHYELRGDGAITLLAQENWDEHARAITDDGRALHRQWVAESFAPQLSGRPDGDECLDLLVVATDAYTWKLLRRDRRMSRKRVEARMIRLVRAVLEGD